MARRERIKRHKQTNKRYLIIVDGHSEVWYFMAMKKALGRNVNFNIEPELPKHKALGELFNYAKQKIKEGYDKVYLLIDFDKVIEEKKESIFYNKLNSKTFKKCISENKLEVLVNSPCFELWILLHFRFTKTQFNNCMEVEKLVKKYISNYDKSEKFFIRQNPDIYQLLEDKLDKAIENAERLGSFDPFNTDKTLAEVHKFISFIKNQQEK